jgi:RimJ/RimL family protein N-acetyltransferase
MEPGTIVRTFTTKSGRPAIVRVVRSDDLDALLSYANNLIDEDTFIMLSGEHITSEYEKEYLEDSIEKVKTGRKIHLVVEVDGQFAGSCEIRRFDRRKSHVGEIGISLARNFREEGVGSVCMETLISEARSIGLKLLYLHCFENNPRALHLYEKHGFIRAGTVPGMYSYKKEYFGEVTLYLPLVNK